MKLKVTEEIESKLRSYDMGYYYTFLAKEATEVLKKYLEWRISRKEELNDGSPIFVTNSTIVKGEPLKTNSIRDMIKRCARKAGLNPKGIWPHCLRKAFRKVLNNSDIDEDTKEDLMGHKLLGSRGSYFDYHDVEEVAGKYMRCKFSGSATIPEDAKAEILLTMWRDQAKMHGIDPMKVKIEKKREIKREPTQEEELELLKQEIKKLRINPQKMKDEGDFENKLVSEKELKVD